MLILFTLLFLLVFIMKNSNYKNVKIISLPLFVNLELVKLSKMVN